MTMSYPSSWAEASDDELVWLLPSICCSIDATGTARLTGLLLDAIERRIEELVGALRNGRGSAEDGRAAVAVLIRQCHVVSASTARRLRERGVRGDTAPRRIERPRPPLDLVGQLSIIACLDRALGRLISGNTRDQLEMGPDDAVAISLATGVNAAYILDDLASQHEILTVAAWLGHIVQGRGAWLPSTMASRLAHELEAANDQVLFASGGERAALLSAIHMTHGAASLLATCRSVLRSGNPRLLSAARQPKGSLWRSWNSPLCHVIAGRLAVLDSERLGGVGDAADC